MDFSKLLDIDSKSYLMHDLAKRAINDHIDKHPEDVKTWVYGAQKYALEILNITTELLNNK